MRIKCHNKVLSILDFAFIESLEQERFEMDPFLWENKAGKPFEFCYE